MITPKLHFYNIDNNIVKAFSTTRNGGVSIDNYSNFNINLYCGDNIENVIKNRNILSAYLAIEKNKILVPHQFHGVESCVITADFFNLSPLKQITLLEGKDALITTEKGVCIGVSTADCIPILIYDPINYVIAAVHAGWRGTLSRITLKTVKEMMLNFNSAPEQLKIVIGPGISLSNFEVGQEVYDKFRYANFDITRIAKLFPAMKMGEEGEKWHIDLKLSNKIDLQQIGVKTENIIDEGICTYDNYNTYFSARKMGINSGRIYNGIILLR